MSSDTYVGGAGEFAPLSEVPADRYEIFRHPCRIRLLDILDDGDRYSLTAVTTELLEHNGRDVPNGQARRKLRIELVHDHLPRLVDADLVRWEDDTVERIATPTVCPTALTSVLEDEPNPEEMLSTVVNPVRLTILELLENREESWSLETLAETLATGEPAAPSQPDRVTLELYHAHLPALESVGLVSFDSDSREIRRAVDTAGGPS